MAGDRVNLERAVRADQRLDGHIVQGHIEGTAVVKKRKETGEVVLDMPKELIKFCVQKGSITVDGVSLTIADVKDTLVSIALIPHTLENTTLGTLNIEDRVNIETDVIGRYIYAFTQ